MINIAIWTNNFVKWLFIKFKGCSISADTIYKNDSEDQLVKNFKGFIDDLSKSYKSPRQIQSKPKKELKETTWNNPENTRRIRWCTRLLTEYDLQIGWKLDSEKLWAPDISGGTPDASPNIERREGEKQTKSEIGHRTYLVQHRTWHLESMSKCTSQAKAPDMFDATPDATPDTQCTTIDNGKSPTTS